MKFALFVLDILGVEKPIERGPDTTASVGLLDEAEAAAFLGKAQKEGRFARLATMLPEEPPITHTHTADGRYESTKDFAEGRYLLVVYDEGKSPVYQRLTLRDNNGVALAKAGWGSQGSEADRLAFNVELPAAAQGRKAQQNQRTLVTVKLVPRVEYVFVAMTGFWHDVNGKKDGTAWSLRARTRAQRLWEKDEMMGGELVTMFFCELGRRQTFIKAHGNSDQWMLMYDLAIDNPRPVGVEQRPLDEYDIGIRDLYRYLNALGAAHPGTVWEVGFFGHAYQQGPIFSPNPEAAAFKHSDERDPKDLDARRKDWKPTVRNTFTTLTAAHMENAVWRIWGCNCDLEAETAIGAVQRELAPVFNKLDLFKYDWNSSDEESSERGVVQMTLGYLLRTIRYRLRASYALNVPKGVGLNVGCYAALPGFGAGLIGVGDMQVTDSKEVDIGLKEGGKVKKVEVADIDGDPRWDFYMRELGRDARGFVDRFGYFEQRFLQERIDEKWVSPPFHHGRYHIRDVFKAKEPADVLWEVIVASSAHVISKDRKVKLTTVEARRGVVAPDMNGHLFSGAKGRVARIEGNKIFLETADDTDCAVLMQQDGKLFAMTRAAGGTEWVVDKRDIARVGENGQALSPKKDGLLHQGTTIW